MMWYSRFFAAEEYSEVAIVYSVQCKKSRICAILFMLNSARLWQTEKMSANCTRPEIVAAVLMTVFGVALGGCSWSEPSPSVGSAADRVERRSVHEPYSPPVAAQHTRLETVVRTAKEQVGRPYLYGGKSPAGFDCSGLVHFAYGHVGVSTPRTTQGLWRELPKLDRSSLRPGDVLFFNIDGKPSHVGLYLGDGEFVHAPSTGRTVSVAELSNPYYNKTFIRAGRVIRE